MGGLENSWEKSGGGAAEFEKYAQRRLLRAECSRQALGALSWCWDWDALR